MPRDQRPPDRPSRRRASLALSALVLASGLLAAPAARADRLGSARERLARIERQIKGQEAAIEDRHRRIDALAGDLAMVETALAATQAELVVAQRDVIEAQASYDDIRDRLQGVTRSAYMEGPLAPVEALLSASSFTELMDRYQYLDSIQFSNASIANQAANRATRLRMTQRRLAGLASRQSAQTVQLQSRQGALRVGLLAQQDELARLNDQRRQAAGLLQRLSLRADPAIAGSGETFGNWGALFLGKLGAPGCQENLIVLVAWQVAEGTAAAHNPLATTHGMEGDTTFNSAGVRNYPSLEVGLQATVETLRQPIPSYGYGAILYDLAHCAPAGTTAMAINASSWCRGCAGGQYVLNVVPLVQADYASFANR